jgi:hypothetical protein
MIVSIATFTFVFSAIMLVFAYRPKPVVIALKVTEDKEGKFTNHWYSYQGR